MSSSSDDVAAWTRKRFGLPLQSVVLVNDVAGTLPGLPPLYTVIVFWTGALAQRHHLKVFKPLAQVGPDDLPPYWMRDALAVAPGFACDCC
jgi:nitrate reductase delta subunit